MSSPASCVQCHMCCSHDAIDTSAARLPRWRWARGSQEWVVGGHGWVRSAPTWPSSGSACRIMGGSWASHGWVVGGSLGVVTQAGHDPRHWLTRIHRGRGAAPHDIRTWSSEASFSMSPDYQNHRKTTATLAVCLQFVRLLTHPCMKHPSMLM